MIERRKHRRIVTLKNFARFILVALLVLAAMNVISEHRAPRHIEYAPAVQQTPVASTPAPEVVHEAPAPPATPLLAETPPPQELSPANQATQQLGNSASNSTPTQQPSNRISITGDESGITITTPTHKLRGGFNRQ
jgi:hypothetical protein